MLNDVDQALSNGVASDNATEDVDKDSGDFGVAGDQLEGTLDGFGSCTTTDIEKVCWGTTVQLDDVHGSHGQTSTIYETANVTIKLDEVETIAKELSVLKRANKGNGGLTRRP